MNSLWFCVPAHGRLALTRICLRQLRRTCDALEHEGVRASAVVVGDDENLETARQLGFGTVERDNRFLSRKFNDGIQLACDPAHNPHPVTHVVPCGSDDWVDHRLFLDLPPTNTMVGFPRISIVREDGLELATRHLNYPGGSGIRIYPTELMKPLGYRPADPDRERGCDTSIMVSLSRYHEHRMVVDHRHHHDYQIVDWKSPSEQLNAYADLAIYRSEPSVDPFAALAGTYPAEALEEMRAHYQVAMSA